MVQDVHLKLIPEMPWQKPSVNKKKTRAYAHTTGHNMLP
jgi:hypothetical protein